MREFAVGKNDAGQRLDRFMTKQGIPISAIMKALRKKDIKVNGTRQSADYKLIEGDVIKAYLNVESKPHKIKFETVSTKLNIIYEDENILLTDKPVGLLCHDNKDCLINRIKAYLYKKGEWSPENEHSFEPSLCNRIDRNTGGIVIAAKNAESLRVMNEKIKLRQVTKLYLCVLSKVPEEREATLTAYLHKDEKNNTVKVSDRKTPFNKTIVTRYKVLQVQNGLALTEVDLLTGRTHQIRAHMAHIGCPLLGDGKYGKKSHGFTQQALYSYKLIFHQPVGFKSPATSAEFESGVFEAPTSSCEVFTENDNKNHLDYLADKSFEVSVDDIWFIDNLQFTEVKS